MKNILLGIFFLVVTVGILVAGYYVGIAFAVLTLALTSIVIAIAFVTFLAYLVWDLFQTKKPKQPTKK
ncbi:hypothetical protein [Vreelandella venusta]|uniref:hypothetical protein n=1 Tax=Vreelandella venusta TaxID=44935 RepID=UPI001172B05C|nr:hypothetical protein [Halomonas venusta]GEK52345.1 hypothetical protein HVE01_30660 [Halomonas venusta]